MTATDEAAPVLVVRRQIAVPREQVFEAWLDSESLAQWMRPGDSTHATVTVDPRVGGGFRIVMDGPTYDAVEHHCEYLAIEPPSLLALTGRPRTSSPSCVEFSPKSHHSPLKRKAQVLSLDNCLIGTHNHESYLDFRSAVGQLDNVWFPLSPPQCTGVSQAQT